MRNGLVELCDYILDRKECLDFNQEQMDSWQENCTIEQGGHNETEKGFHLSSLRYRGVITIERIKDANAIWLIAIVSAWLSDHSEDREFYALDDPEIEIIKLDEKYIDIELTVDFVDELYLSEADGGPIEWDGKFWTIDGYQLKIAETVEVKGNAK